MQIPRHAAASIVGVVLAGGRGARMGGVDKGWVAWEGRPLIEHVLGRLRPQVERVLVSANRNLDRYRALAGEVVSDDAARWGEYAGPLAGMLAALVRAPLPWCAFVPCDAPLLDTALVARLAGAGDGRPAVARCAGRMQPVFCLLPGTLAPVLERALEAGERRPQDFLAQIGAVEVDFEHEAAFINVNRP
jgi:molybdopterin-guanine dinucleotide biosynthesis protein A